MPKKKRGGWTLDGEPAARFSAKQGQYLAYLHLYRKLHRRSPSEKEVAQFFRVSPPSAHQMLVKLTEVGLISREPGAARSIRVLVPPSEIPPLEDDPEEAPAPGKRSGRSAAGAANLYTLDVFLIGGPLPEEFEGQTISRTIEIRGDQTLEQLHQAIFRAFDRFEEHFYEFQFGKGPQDPAGPRYVLPQMLTKEVREPSMAGDVGKTTLDSLGLKVHQAFGYWFDYGDDWWHQINVEAIQTDGSKKAYPRVTKRVGKSPPQYADEED